MADLGVLWSMDHIWLVGDPTFTHISRGRGWSGSKEQVISVVSMVRAGRWQHQGQSSGERWGDSSPTTTVPNSYLAP